MPDATKAVFEGTWVLPHAAGRPDRIDQIVFSGDDPTPQEVFGILVGFFREHPALPRLRFELIQFIGGVVAEPSLDIVQVALEKPFTDKVPRLNWWGSTHQDADAGSAIFVSADPSISRPTELQIVTAKDRPTVDPEAITAHILQAYSSQ